MSPYIGTLEAFAFAAIASSALHDIFCAIWLALYMGVRGRLKDTWAALRTRSGKVVILGALLGGPIGMTGYVIAINNIGAGYTAIISAFYPAVGAILAFIILKERMSARQLVAFACALGGIVAMGVLSLTDAETAGDPVLGLVGAAACVLGWGSEAVLCGWGMRDDAVDNETALQIRETTSALVYAIIVLPAFGAWRSRQVPSRRWLRALSPWRLWRARPRTSSTTSPSARRWEPPSPWRSTSATRHGRCCSRSSCRVRCPHSRRSCAASSSSEARFLPRVIGTSSSAVGQAK